MTEIAITEHAPEIGQTIIKFTLSEGEFSDADLKAIKTLHPDSGFSFKNKSVISVFMERNFYPAEQAMIVLRQRLPEAMLVWKYGNTPKWVERILEIPQDNLPRVVRIQHKR